MSNASMTLVVLAIVAFFFVTELLPLAVTAMAGAIAVGVLGIIPMNQVFSGLRLLPTTGTLNFDIDAEAAVVSGSSIKQWLTGLTLLFVVLIMALDLKSFPLEVAATLGALFLVFTKCIGEKEAYKGIDWVTIFLFAGMLPIATAMDKSGAGKLVADWVVSMMGHNPSPYVVTAVLFALSAGLTQFMSNTACTALLAPIAIGIAKGLEVSPHAVMMAVGIAASCAFATPVGTPPNTLVLGPGGYKFKDYVKAGSGLTIFCMIVSVIVIPMVWPFALAK